MQETETQTGSKFDLSEWALHADRINQAIACTLPHSASRVAFVSQQKQGDVLVVDVRGVMSRGGDYWGGTSTAAIISALEVAKSDESIKGVLLSINSPGGTFAGTMELGHVIGELSAIKPVYSAITDLGASAAYWAASQSTRVYAAPDALVGSIGTFAAVADFSRYFENAGVKVHVIRADTTGEFKGAGTFGTAITDTQLAHMRQLMTSRNQFFLDAVSQGRNMPQAQLSQIADGRVFTANESLQLGLVDQVGTASQALSELMSAITSKSKGKAMSSDDTGTIAAVAPQVVNAGEMIREKAKAYRDACCGAASSDEILSWMAEGVTVEQAVTNTLTKMVACLAKNEEQVKSLSAELSGVKSELASVKANKSSAGITSTSSIGVEPLSSDPEAEISTPETAVKQMDEAIRVAIAEGHATTRQQAFAYVARINPGLAQAVRGR